MRTREQRSSHLRVEAAAEAEPERVHQREADQAHAAAVATAHVRVDLECRARQQAIDAARRVGAARLPEHDRGAVAAYIEPVHNQHCDTRDQRRNANCTYASASRVGAQASQCTRAAVRRAEQALQLRVEHAQNRQLHRTLGHELVSEST